MLKPDFEGVGIRDLVHALKRLRSSNSQEFSGMSKPIYEMYLLEEIKARDRKKIELVNQRVYDKLFRNVYNSRLVANRGMNLVNYALHKEKVLREKGLKPAAKWGTANFL